ASAQMSVVRPPGARLPRRAAPRDSARAPARTGRTRTPGSPSRNTRPVRACAAARAAPVPADSSQLRRQRMVGMLAAERLRKGARLLLATLASEAFDLAQPLLGIREAPALLGHGRGAPVLHCVVRRPFEHAPYRVR